jgi:hypothetical protein
MTRLRVVLVVLAILAVALPFLVTDNTDSMTVCHRPPGNVSSAITIQVAASAVPAHLAHADTLGACPVSPSR